MVEELLLQGDSRKN